jgi:hypothetical protein
MDAKHLRQFAHLRTTKTTNQNVTKRSHSESDLGKYFEGDLKTPGFLIQKLPASAREIKTDKKLSTASGSHIDQNRTKLLGSVGHLLAQFRRQKTWHKFKLNLSSESELETSTKTSTKTPELTTFV